MSWFLFTCKPREDNRAELNLKNQGYTCYRPVIQVQKKRNGKQVLVEESLFPRYIFVQLPDGVGNWRSLLATRGIANVVRFGELPTAIPQALIDEIKANETQLKQTETPVKGLKAGDKVRITSGPFEFLEAIYKQSKGEDRVLVLLNILQQPQLIELTPDQIDKAD
ncbi:transcription/translation regulatory transformer protein RfaH [Oceanospirillum sanctuarii]|uniref:transcription/translation regulatory transformer protein RfaH n=1 Tax=Oceanospirillum sanctuarii TaxID=1434821 RepID=UPI001593F383|nr:transcription/translation regulatory transformer protein RfaH [Oceanospirillum sanctuarii]